MKKVLIIFLGFLSLLLVSCDFLIPATTKATDQVTTEITNQTTESTSTLTTFDSTNNSTTSLTTDFNTTISTEYQDEIDIKLNAGQDTVDINTEWIDAGAVFVLNNNEFQMLTDDTVDESTLGIYEIEYYISINDTYYYITRYVIVVDQTAPVISLNLGVDTVKVGTNWIDTGVTITDNSKEIIIPEVEGRVFLLVPGTYQITYIAVDSSGNTSRITRYVTVIE